MAERSPDANNDRSEFTTAGGARVTGRNLEDKLKKLEAKQSKVISGGSKNPSGAGPSDPGKDSAQEKAKKKDKPPKSSKGGGKTEAVREPDSPKVEEPSPLTPDQTDLAPSNVERQRGRKKAGITGEEIGGVEKRPKGRSKKSREGDQEEEPASSPKKKPTKKKASDAKDTGIVPVVAPTVAPAPEPTPPPSVIENLPPSPPSVDSSKEEKLTYWKDELRKRGAEYYINIKGQLEGGRKARRVSESNQELFTVFAEAQDELYKLVDKKSVNDLVEKIAREAGIVEEQFPSSEVWRHQRPLLPPAAPVPSAPTSGENLTPEVTRYKEMLLEAIRAVEEHPLNNDGELRNPLNYPKFKASKKALLDGGMKSEDIAKLDIKILEDAGLDLVEWRKKILEKSAAGEKKVSLRKSPESGSLEIKLGLALSAAIQDARVAAERGEDPSNPLDDPKVKEIEDRIRETIDPGAEDLDAVILKTENEILGIKSFNLEQLKAQAEAVRAERDKVSPSATETEAQRKEFKEAIEFGILDIARTPFGRRGRIRNPLENPRAQAAWIALEDAGVSESDIRQLRGQFYSEFGFNWKEWQQRIIEERDAMNAGVRKDRKKREAEQDKFIKTANPGAIADAVERVDLQDAAGQALSRRSDYEGLDDEGEREIARKSLGSLKPAVAPVAPTALPPVTPGVVVGGEEADLEQLRKEQLEEEQKINKVTIEGGAPESKSEGGAPAPETSPAPEGAEVETPVKLEDPIRLKEILDSARKSFLTMENDPSTDVFNLRGAREGYEKARAEYVGNIVERFVDEQEALALGRAESESRGVMRVFAPQWRRFAESGIGKILGLKREKLVKKATRGIAIGGLLGLGAFSVGLPAAGIAWSVVRRSLGAVATTVGTFELLQGRAGKNLLTMTDQKLEDLSPHDIEDRLRQLTVWARLQGSWDNVRPVYEKTKARYLEQLQVAQGFGLKVEEYAEKTQVVEEEKLRELFKLERGKDRKRIITGLGVSAGVFAGGFVLYDAYHEYVASSVTQGPAASEQHLSGLARFKNWFSGAVTYEDASQPKTGRLHLPASEVPENSGVATRVSGVSAGAMPDVVGSPRTGPRELFPTVFQPGEAPLHEARKAIALYMAETDKSEFKSLTKAQRLWAEERLWDATKEQLKAAGSLPDDRHWQVGKQLTFRRDAIEKVLQDLKEQNADKLADQYKDAIVRVNWRRYFAAGGRGVWEGDQGIKVRIPVSSLEDVASHAGGKGQASDYLRGRITEVPRQPLNTDPSQAPDLLTWNDGGNTVVETTTAIAPSGGGVPSGDIFEATPEFYGALNEHMMTKLSGLEKPYYNSVRGLSIGKVLDKRFWGWSEENSWPMPKGVKPNHRDLARYGNFQDSIKAVLGPLGRSEQIEARKLSVDEFIRKYISKK